jgi:hypothetical protein
MKHDIKKERQTIMVRGIAASIQAMAMPTWDALRGILAKFGWKLTREENQTNKQNEE